MMTASEIVEAYGVNLATAKRYLRHKAPVDDREAMLKWIEEHRSRMCVGKYTPRYEEPLPEMPQPAAREIEAEVVNVQPLAIAENASSDEPDAPADELDAPHSTLARLEEAERVAYQRYIDRGGSERAGQLWLLVCDQKRKLIADQAKQASDISEAETKFMSECWEVVWELFEHLKASPALLGMICEGLDRDAIQFKVQDHLERTIRGAAQSLASIMRGTSLEILLPEHARTQPHEKITRA